jgi:serine/threonine protein kinase
MGIMLFEMLTGVLPFASDDISLMWNMHLYAPVPSLKDRSPAAASEDLDAIISMLLAKAPAGRFDSALAVIRALDTAQG